MVVEIHSICMRKNILELIYDNLKNTTVECTATKRNRPSAGQNKFQFLKIAIGSVL